MQLTFSIKKDMILTQEFLVADESESEVFLDALEAISFAEPYGAGEQKSDTG